MIEQKTFKVCMHISKTRATYADTPLTLPQTMHSTHIHTSSSLDSITCSVASKIVDVYSISFSTEPAERNKLVLPLEMRANSAACVREVEEPT